VLVVMGMSPQKMAMMSLMMIQWMMCMVLPIVHIAAKVRVTSYLEEIVYVVEIGHASRGKGKVSSSRDGDNKQQLTFSQSELLVSMDTGDITNRSFMLPATPPSKKVRSYSWLSVTSYHLSLFLV